MSDAPKTRILATSPTANAVRVSAPQAPRATAPLEDVELGLHKPSWEFGLRIAPHHLQSLTRYHERQVELALRDAFPHPWGVIGLVLNEGALHAGQIVVERLTAIMPDGTQVVVGPSGNARVAPRSFEPELRAANGADVDVYLGLPLERYDRANVESEENARRDMPRMRFTSTRTSVKDFNTGTDPVDVEWLSENLQLMSNTDRRDDCAVLPIAKLCRSQSGQIELSPTFAPPTLRLRASRVLEQAVMAAHAALQSAETALLTQPPGDAVLPTLSRQLVLSVLGELTPKLGRLLESPTTSAREAFDAMADAVGALATFAPNGTVTLPAYDHASPAPAFIALATEAQRVLYWVGAPAYRQLRLERTAEDGVWVGGVSEPGVLGRTLLLVISGAPQEVLHEQIARLIRVAPFDELSAVANAAMESVRLLPEVRKLHGLPVPANAACFRFDTRSNLWRNVVNKGSLAIQVPTFQSPPLALTLFVEEKKG